MSYPDRQNEERTLKDLPLNVAALLCYVGGWISGIVFLVLEQKSRVIRFHALQSIIVFGILSAAIGVIGAIPVIGKGFAAALGWIAFILWIILLVKAITGEYFKLPWAGDLAEKLTKDSLSQTTTPKPPVAEVVEETGAVKPSPAAEITPPVPPISKAAEFKASYYSGVARTARIASSAFAIAWSVVLMVFFNFYNQYIAYYEPVRNGTTYWQMHTLVTVEFRLWLPILTTTLVLTIVANAILIAIDKYYLRKIFMIILDGFGAATVITLLVLFPFDFSSLPGQIGAETTSYGVMIALVITTIAFIIGAIVKFVQLIVHLVEGKF